MSRQNYMYTSDDPMITKLCAFIMFSVANYLMYI